jgi:hypothetical protein
MPTKSASKIITRDQKWLGPAIPPGEILLEEYLKPLGVGQLEAAKRLDISLNRLNEIENIAATLDASAGRLGSTRSRAARGAERLLTVSSALFGRLVSQT